MALFLGLFLRLLLSLFLALFLVLFLLFSFNLNADQDRDLLAFFVFKQR